MKYESFDGRWDEEELSALLARDGVDIVIRFITESDYKIRVYYEGKVIITYSDSNAFPNNDWGQYQQQYLQQPIQQVANGYGGTGGILSSTIRTLFGDERS